MLMAGRVLDDEVGSAAPVFLALLAIHVIAGLTAVASGASAALARKGSPRHIRAGRWFYRAITVVFATATGSQRQAGQIPDRTARAQHRIGQFRQLISAGAHAGMEICPEPRQHGGWPAAGILWQTAHHGLRSRSCFFGENT